MKARILGIVSVALVLVLFSSAPPSAGYTAKDAVAAPQETALAASSYLDTDWEWQMGKPRSSLRGVWGSSSSDIFAVGEMGAILHYDGADWVEMDSTVGGAEIRAVWGSAGSDVFISVGFPSRIFHYDGADWKPQECDTSNTADYVFDIWGASGTDVFGVGRDTVGGNQRSVIRHYDGVSGAGFIRS
jgi:hypothetical protein